MLKSRITYSIFALGALFFVYFYGGVVPWAVFIIALSLPAISFTYLLLTYFSIKYYESCRYGAYVKGERVGYSCIFSNEIPIPFVYIRISIQTPETMVSGKPDIKDVSLTGGRTLRFEYDIECKYRGRYEIGIKCMEFVDFLNIFKLKLEKERMPSVTVFPRILVSEQFAEEGMAPSDFRVAMLRKGMEDQSVVNLREYAYGDSSRTIHWKLSAKMQKLIVTDRESGFDNRVVMLLHLGRNKQKKSRSIVLEDRLIEDLTASVNYFLNRNIPVDLIYDKSGLVYDRIAGRQDFEQMHRLMAEIEFDSGTGIYDLLEGALGNHGTNNTLFVFSTVLNADLYGALKEAGVTDRSVFLRYCDLDKSDEEAYNYQRMLVRQGVNMKHLEQEEGVDGKNEEI